MTFQKIFSLTLITSVLLCNTMIAQIDTKPLPGSDIEKLQQNCKTCQSGLDLLKNNMYKYPNKPSEGVQGKKAWNEVWSVFTKNHLPSCKAMGAYINSNLGKKVTAPIIASYSQFNVKKWEDYFDSSVGIVMHGSRIPNYCPGLHRRQFDCLEASRRMIEISIPGVEKIISILSTLECTPENGYAHCRLAGNNNITILGTEKVSASAMVNVDNIYNKILGLLKPEYPISKMNGYKVYMTNEETISELDALVPINSMWKTGTGEGTRDDLRGGTSQNFLWISEQMICKTGVVTRGEKDKTTRTFDQVVHEFGHALDFRFNLSSQYNSIYTNEENEAFPKVERFTWSIQHWFGVPTGTLSSKENELLTKIFKEKTTFSCSTYIPNN
ncbi:MAG: hypothetical protein R2828_12135 [Saprospiraceae bacterium]